jgi:methyl-accepting chemotaxis protein
MKILANASIRGKLFTLLGVLVVGFAAYGIFAVTLTKKVEINGPIYQEIIMGKDLVADILPPPEYIIESYLTVLQLADRGNRDNVGNLVGYLKQLENDYNTRHEYWINTLPPGALKQEIIEASYRPAKEFYSVATDEFVPAVKQGDYDLGHKAVNKLTVLYNEHRAAIDKAVALANNMNSATEKAAGESISNGMTILLSIAVLSLLLIISLSLLIAGQITKPITKVLDMIKDVAQGEGDLTKRLEINSKDEIGDLAKWFNTFMDKLHDIIYQVALNTEQLASAANEISASAEQLSAGAKEQTNQTAQVSIAIEEMTATIVETSKNTGDAAEKAKEAASQSQEGGRLAEDTSRGMEEIVESSNTTAQNIKGLAEKATAIGEIIKVIDDIADQTNLLALNAAIEAARAGEQGRGFAVVADEVRKLAERTTKATKEVAETIKGIQADVSTANSQINDSRKIVDGGKELVQKTNASLTEIFASIEGVQEMMRQIATASEEQSAAAEEISKSIENVNRISKESATGTEQAASAAEQLNRQSTELKALVGGFKLRKKIEAGI